MIIHHLGRLSAAVLMVSWIAAGPAVGRSLALQQTESFRGIEEIEGTVQSVKIHSRVIDLKDSGGHLYQITVGPDTPITDINRGSLKLSDLSEKETLHVYYDTRDMSARHIDRVSRSGAAALFSPS